MILAMAIYFHILSMGHIILHVGPQKSIIDWLNLDETM